MNFLYENGIGPSLKHILVVFSENSTQIKELSPLIKSKISEIRPNYIVSGEKLNEKAIHEF